jgi:hypothetical protein
METTIYEEDNSDELREANEELEIRRAEEYETQEYGN